MGRKSKPQKNHEKDRLLARSIRKRAQHTKQNDLENESKKDICKGTADVVDVKEWKAKNKEKKTHEQVTPKKVRWNLRHEVARDQDTPLETQPPISNVKVYPPRSEKTEIIVPVITKKQSEPKPFAPTAPMWDMKKVKEIFADRKKSSLDYLSTYRVFKRRHISNTDLTTLKSLPRYNGISREIERIVTEVRVKNEQLKEEIEEDRKEIQEEFRDIFNEEFSLYTDFKKYSTALEELRIVLTALEKNEESYKNSEAIPTRSDFKEVTKILRNFIAIRNERLEQCFTTEFQKNKTADNYADMFRKYRKNKSLLECILPRRSKEKTGYRVLSISNEILTKMVAQLRIQMKNISSKKENTTWRQWNRKVRNYDVHVRKHRQDIKQIEECLSRKSNEVRTRSDEAKELLQKLREVKKDFLDQKTVFEEKIVKTKLYRERLQVGDGFEKDVEEIKDQLRKDIDSLKSLREKFQESKVVKRNAFHAHLFEEAEKMKSEYLARNKKSEQLEMIQLRLKDDLRMKNGIILQYEEMHEEFRSEMARCKRMLAELENEKEVTQYKNQKFRQKIREMKRKMQNFSNHDESFAKCIISK